MHVCVHLKGQSITNMTGLQLVSRPVEQVYLLRGLGWVQSPISATAQQTNRQADWTGGGCMQSPYGERRCSDNF